LQASSLQGARIRLLWAIAIFWAGLYLYIPILTPYVTRQGGSTSMAGIVVAAYGVPQLTTRIFLGRWADRIGRRRVFLFMGLVTVAVSSLGMALFPTPWAFAGFRVLAGLAASTWAMFSMLYVSYYPHDSRTVHAMGWVTFANNSGQVVATLAGGFVAARWGWPAPFWTSAALAVLGILLVLTLPEGNWASVHSAPPKLRYLFRYGSLRVASGLGIFNQMVTFLTTFGYVPLWAARHGMPKADLGVLMMVGILPSTLFAVITGTWLSKHWSLRTLSWVGFSLMAIFAILTPLRSGALWLFFTQAGLGIGRGIVSPTLMAMSIAGVEARWRTTAHAVYQAVYAGGMIAGPALGAFVVARFSLPSIFWLAGGSAIVGIGLSLSATAHRLQLSPKPSP
jgi:MFS family permease